MEFAIAVLLVACFVPDNLWPQEAPASPRSVAPAEFIDAALKATVSSPSLHSQIENANGAYFILFIPGILGSELTAESGESLWGREAASAPLLAWRPGAPPVRSAILLDYPIYNVTRSDVYGTFEHDVTDVNGGRATYREFAYDWRKDISEISKDLDEKMRGEWSAQLKGKRLIVVAHSMGGLVAWTWKNSCYRNNEATYNFKWWRLVLLGSPLKGSCESLRMLLAGYRPYPGASVLEKNLYELLFSQLRPAALTFPSVFELLPKESDDPSDACLFVRDATGEHPQRHFDPGVWTNPDSSIFQFLNGASSYNPLRWRLSLSPWRTHQAVWEILGLSQAEFDNDLTAVLKRARDFRENFDSSEQPLSGQVDYFYSDEYQTTARVVIDADRGTIVADAPGTLQAGDGRVLVTSAIPALAGDALTPRELHSSHGDLVKDGTFLRYLDLELNRRIAAATVEQVAALITADPSAQAAFVAQGVILEPGTVAALASTSGQTGGTDPLGLLRQATFAASRRERGFGGYGFGAGVGGGGGRYKCIEGPCGGRGSTRW
jgi:hypothetical protein